MPLPRSAVAALAPHRTGQVEERRATAEAREHHGLVFTTEIGTPLEPRNVLRRFELLARRAGRGGVHRHTLRHSAASFVRAAGTQDHVLRRFEGLAERPGLRGVTLHTLRHSAASFLLAVGTHTKVVQEHLGHSSYAITADIYSHVGPAQQREAADRLDQALRW